MINEEQLSRLEPVPDEPGWLVDPQTGEVFNEADLFGDDEEDDDERDQDDNDEEEDEDDEEEEREDDNDEDKEEKDDENDSEEENGENQESEGDESTENEGGESGESVEGGESGAEGATEGAAESASEAAGEASAEAAREAAAEAATEAAAEATAEVAAEGAAATVEVWGPIALAVIVIIIIIGIIFMAFMGSENNDESTSGETDQPAYVPPSDVLEYCSPAKGFYTTAEAMRIFGSSKQVVSSRLVWVDFPVKVTGKILVHEKAAPCFEAAGKEIVASGTSYGIVNSGTFNWRYMVSGSRLSMHSFGIAIDINAPENCWQCGTPPNCRTDIPREVSDAFKRYGFNWGAEWSSACDAMHFEWHGAER